MKAGLFAIAAAMAVGVSASGHNGRRHAHEALHLEKRLVSGTGASAPEATCGCTTYYTTCTGEGVLLPKPAPPTSVESTHPTISPPAPGPTSPQPTAPAPVPTSPAPEPPHVPMPTEAPPPPPKSTQQPKVEAKVESPKDAPKTTPGKLGAPGDIWGITYTPYTEDAGTCKSQGQIKSDIELIASKGFTAIRVYSTDCSALEFIPEPCAAHGVNLILGVFIDGSGIGGAKEQLDAIIAWQVWGQVELIVIGNEALYSSPPRCTAVELASFISSSKAALVAAGYNGPVTTAEPLNVWQESAGALCDAVDVVGMNTHAFFNADVDASMAGKFAQGQLAIGAALCPGKEAYILETGWPSAGICNGLACPGPSEQAIAFKTIRSFVGRVSVAFSFGNDLWKEEGKFKCERSWGAIQIF